MFVFRRVDSPYRAWYYATMNTEGARTRSIMRAEIMMGGGNIYVCCRFPHKSRHITAADRSIPVRSESVFLRGGTSAQDWLAAKRCHIAFTIAAVYAARRENSFSQRKNNPQIPFDVFPRHEKWHQMPFEPSAQSKKRHQISFEPSAQGKKQHQMPFELSTQHEKRHQMPFELSAQSKKYLQTPFDVFPQHKKRHQMPFEPSVQGKKYHQIPFELSAQSKKRHQITFELFPQAEKRHQIAFDVSAPSERRFQAASGRSARGWRGNYDTVTGRRGMRRKIIQIKESIL